MSLMITPYNNRNNYIQQRPAFTAKAPNVADATATIANATTSKSKLFEPLSNAYDRFTDGIAEHVTSKFVNWKPLNFLADKLKNTNNLFQHCLTVGSVVTSGLYMQRTITNKNLDKDRRNTLAVNQGLTLGVSTIGAYALDKYLKGWWDNVTAKFAGHLLNDNEFYEKFKQEKASVARTNEMLKKSNAELKPMPKIEKMVKKHSYYKSLSAKEADTLLKKVKGMSPLRTMIVFGFVYRYFVPVAVTKPANKLCEMYLQKKKENNPDTKKA